MGKLRQGIGVDNLDVKTTTEGGAELTAGKYIGKNAYTEVTVGQDGKSQINLNLDLTDSITLRGRADNDGQTGIGVFLEKDY
jgi:translocation and assembly module TamB